MDFLDDEAGFVNVAAVAGEAENIIHAGEGAIPENEEDDGMLAGDGGKDFNWDGTGFAEDEERRRLRGIVYEQFAEDFHQRYGHDRELPTLEQLAGRCPICLLHGSGEEMDNTVVGGILDMQKKYEGRMQAPMLWMLIAKSYNEHVWWPAEELPPQHRPAGGAPWTYEMVEQHFEVHQVNNRTRRLARTLDTLDVTMEEIRRAGVRERHVRNGRTRVNRQMVTGLAQLSRSVVLVTQQLAAMEERELQRAAAQQGMLTVENDIGDGGVSGGAFGLAFPDHR